MRRIYLTKFVALAAILLGFSPGLFAQTVTFNYSSSVQTFSVGAGVFTVSVDAQGAKGGNDCCGYGTGGGGGRVVCTLVTTPGQILNVYVGSAGTTSGGSYGAVVNGGTNAIGSNGGNGAGYGGGAGAASEVRIGVAKAVIAGGGGGSGYGCSSGSGGSGGGTTGGNGLYCGSYSSSYNGAGGSSSGGGAGSATGPSQAGSAGTGGNAYSSGYGGGGGGGYYGGGGAYYGGGGGGSSFVDATQTTGTTTHTPGYNTSGNGVVTLIGNCTQPVNGAITGNTLLCGIGALSVLSTTATAGGVWSSTNTSAATITNLGVVTSMGVGTTTISYSNVYTCGRKDTFVVVTVAATPNAITVPGPVCAGSTITLTDVSGGGSWTSGNALLATVASGTGIVTGVAGGTPRITYTLPSGCSTSTTVTVNNTPLGISGFPAVCVGSCTTLSDGTPGGVWSSIGTGVATIGSGSGTACGGTVGVTSIVYALSTGCKATASFTVNSTPSPYSLSGSSGYCLGGSGVPITMSPSTFGINYQLYNGSSVVGSPVPGTGSVVSFGSQTVAGVYSVVAINPTTGCTRNMLTTTTVTIQPLPIAFHVLGSGGYCDMGAGSGLDLILDSSQTGTLYTTIASGVAGFPTLGTGVLIDFGTQPAGDYTIVAQDATTGCTNNMLGDANIVAYALPDVFSITPNTPTAYCSGSSGVRIGLDMSDPGAYYLLYNNTTLVDSMPGSSSALDFGLQTMDGDYTIVARNVLSGCTNNMFGDALVSINPLPNTHVFSPAGPGSSYCAGGTGVDLVTDNSDAGTSYQLYFGSTMVGASQEGGGTGIDFGYQTPTGLYHVLATDDLTGCNVLMSGVVNVTTTPLPNIFNMNIGGGYCIGGTGVDVNVNNSNTGMRYQLYYNGSSAGQPWLAGTGHALDFGLQTMEGEYTVMATNTSTNCSSTMNGISNVAINPLPASFNVTGGGSFCAGGAGEHVGLDFSSLGVNYQLYRGTTLVGSPVGGLSSGLDFGTVATPGSYTIIGTNTVTGCRNNMAGSAIVNISALPTPYTVTGNGSYCEGGAGLSIGLGGSSSSVHYQLFDGGTVVGSPVNGTGLALSFGMMTASGMYTVVGTDTITGCTNNMGGSASVSINALPSAYAVTGGGDYCTGGTGVHVGLSASVTGVNYQLYDASGPIGTAVTGSGHALDFGLHTATGMYTVHATNATTGCVNTMTGAASVLIDPLPTAFTVTGGGNYCAGSTGIHVGVSNSITGTNYWLYRGTTPVDTMTGFTGSPVDFGLLTTAGTYTVRAANSITACSSTMAGSATIGVNALPVQYTVLGSSTFCTGAAGSPVLLNGSVNGITYQLLINGVDTGSPMAGTGSALNFGIYGTGGTYTVKATNSATSCSNNMNGSAVLVANPTPNAYSVTGGGSYCASGTGVAIGLIGSGSGINYTLYNGADQVGLPVGGTGAALDFGLMTSAGTYTIRASNTSTHCTQNMTGDAIVTIMPTVTPAITLVSDMGANVCPGTPVTYTTTIANGGASPVYSWMVDGVYAGGGSTYSYVPMNGDVVTAMLTSDAACASSPTASSSLTMTLRSYTLPDVSIAAGGSICPGSAVTFTATAANSGASPVYDWFVNNVMTGSGTSYTYVPRNGDIVSFLMVSDVVCRTNDTAYSNDIVVAVDSPMQPAFSISSHLGPIIGVGQVDTFRALVTNLSGASLSYQWYVNSEMIRGANTERYVSNMIFNNDSVSCMVTAADGCGGAAGTAAFRVHLTNLAVGQVANGGSEISVVPNPNKGEFTVKGSISLANDEKVSLEITNMLGQVVYRENIATTNGVINQRIATGSMLANGMYILSLHSEAETKVFHLVIEQ